LGKHFLLHIITKWNEWVEQTPQGRLSIVGHQEPTPRKVSNQWVRLELIYKLVEFLGF